MHRVAIIGANRGLHHAAAYTGLEGRARIVAVAEVDAARREAAAATLGANVYADWREMLLRERPSIVHAVTGPRLPRATWVEPCAAAGVQVLVIEKPIALSPAEAEALARAVHGSALRVAVNHQRRYMPFADELVRLVGEGRPLGRVHFVRVSTIGKVMDLAPHALDLALLAVGDAALTRVWAQADGGETSPDYPGPQRLMAAFGTATGARILLEATPEDEATLGRQDFAADYPDFIPAYGPHRCNMDVWAEQGRFWWREYGSWGVEFANGRRRQEPTAFKRDDLPAQRRFSAALLDWADGLAPHRCRLENAWQAYAGLAAATVAAAHGRQMTLAPAGLDVPLAATQAGWEAALAWLSRDGDA